MELIPQWVIEKAIEGGWETLPYWKYAQDSLYWDNGEYITFTDICLNPVFWQALGKAMGWTKETCPKCGGYQNCYGYCYETVATENFHAHRFYDLILTKGDTAAFWESLKVTDK